MLTSWKKDPEMAFFWPRHTPTTSSRNFKDLHGAWMRCFDKTAAKAPVFKKKSDNRDSIRFVNFDKYCRLEKVA